MKTLILVLCMLSFSAKAEPSHTDTCVYFGAVYYTAAVSRDQGDTLSIMVVKIMKQGFDSKIAMAITDTVSSSKLSARAMLDLAVRTCLQKSDWKLL